MQCPVGPMVRRLTTDDKVNIFVNLASIITDHKREEYIETKGGRNCNRQKKKASSVKTEHI